jgi:uncharacterized protein YndB with AHSA1/START domain
MNSQITVESIISGPIEKIWKYWTEPEHITKWTFASSDWSAPHASNDLKEGGRFNTRMEAKDGSASFNFEGTYTEVIPHKLIAYTMDDGRKVKIEFVKEGENYRVIETFDPEQENLIEMQKQGWQSILENFKTYTEENK